MNKKEARMTLVTICIISTLIFTGCVSGQTSQTQRANSEVVENAEAASGKLQSGGLQIDFDAKSYTDDENLDRLLNDIIYKTELTTKELESGLNDYLNATGDTYNGYKQNKQMLADWYALALNKSDELYKAIQEDCSQYHEMLLNDPKYAQYKVWNDALSESYEVWNDALSDYYGDWNDFFSDIYRNCTDMIQESLDQYGYDEYSDAWDEMYDTYQESWDAMYDLRQDAWDDLYKARQDTWDELYSR